MQDTLSRETLGPIGLGTWAIGGPFFSGSGHTGTKGAPLGYGQVDDNASTRALHAALEHGVKLIDTADVYGTGHAERIIGQALKGKRDKIILATKFGKTYDEASQTLTGERADRVYIRQAVEASLRRLGTDCIDLYQFHNGDHPIAQAEEVADTLEALRKEGLIRHYGWSTDDPARARAFPGSAAFQFRLNVLADAPGMISLCDESLGLARLPLAMGALSGKFNAATSLPADDIRARPPAWLDFLTAGGQPKPAWQNRLNAIREILTSRGRTLAQGALCWVIARHPNVVAIPGCRTEAQLTENLRAAVIGPLTPEQMAEIDRLLQRG